MRGMAVHTRGSHQFFYLILGISEDQLINSNKQEGDLKL